MADIEAKVLEAMKKAGRPMRPGDVAAATGLPKAEVSRTLQALKKAGKVVSPQRCFWAPAE